MNGKSTTPFPLKTLIIALGCICIVSAIEFSLFAGKYAPSYVTEEWVKVGENEDGQMFYERQYVARNTAGEAIVWMKFIYSNALYHDIVAVLPDIAGAYCSLMLDRIDCRQWEYIVLRVVYKTFEGKVLRDTIDEKGRYRIIGYRQIPSGSFIEEVAKGVCAGYSL